jgi:hypothetical protein
LSSLYILARFFFGEARFFDIIGTMLNIFVVLLTILDSKK